MGPADLCCYLDWDSEFFGCRIARVTAGRLSPDDMDRVATWCTTHAIDCLYFLADTDSAETVRLAEDNGFRFVDTRVTLETRLDDRSAHERRAAHGVIRVSTPSDVPALRAIARASHRDSRFYYDANFADARCDALYETWIEQSCHGYADVVLVAADAANQPVGYISCQRTDREGQIALLAVDARAQGKGLGQTLVSESLRWFAERGMTQVTVVTQGRNSRSQRAYQACGFLTRSMQHWYHRWVGR